MLGLVHHVLPDLDLFSLCVSEHRLFLFISEPSCSLPVSLLARFTSACQSTVSPLSLQLGLLCTWPPLVPTSPSPLVLISTSCPRHLCLLKSGGTRTAPYFPRHVCFLFDVLFLLMERIHSYSLNSISHQFSVQKSMLFHFFIFPLPLPCISLPPPFLLLAASLRFNNSPSVQFTH